MSVLLAEVLAVKTQAITSCLLMFTTHKIRQILAPQLAAAADSEKKCAASLNKIPSFRRASKTVGKSSTKFPAAAGTILQLLTALNSNPWKTLYLLKFSIFLRAMTRNLLLQ